MSRLVLLVAVVAAPLAWAEPTQCSRGALTRSVEVVYSNPPAQTPCEVIYSKPDEGGTRASLWSAQTEPGYCEVRAEGLIDKLEGLGWTCTGPAASASAAEATVLSEDEASSGD
jgi:hypothetical protein